jgi:hypothetical protein
MKICVRPVDLERERKDLLDILNRNLPDVPHARRFDWLYLRHPAGAGWAWFAYESENGKNVGVASVFPRAMWLGEEIRICGQVGDFAIEREYRSLGPALLLQRATFEPVNRGILGWTYDCPPHERGMSTFRRLGMHANTRMQRYARLLRSGRQVSKILGRTRVAEAMAKFGDLVLSLATSRQRKVSGLEVLPFDGEFGEEFSKLDERVGGSAGIRSRRRAEDLNWRYGRDPLHPYQILVARRNGELQAFAVFAVLEDDCYMADLFGLSLEQTGPLLADAISEAARQGSLQTVQALLAEGHWLEEALCRAGFRHRGPAQYVVAYAQPGAEADLVLRQQPKWFFQRVDVVA